MSPQIATTAFLTSLALRHANPVVLSARGKDLKTFTNPICGNDAFLAGKPVSLSTTLTVAVRPDCDDVINSICNTAVAQVDRNAQVESTYHYLRGDCASSGTCEGHILLSHHTLADPLSYESCVAEFQSIEQTCMLLDASGQKDRYGKEGSQFGVRKIGHHPDGGAPGYPVWQADTVWNQKPGYMLGAKGVFGTVAKTNVSDLNADGTLK